ncbi:type III pantothenate kinase [Lacinutrix salivirga]
MNLIVDVGNSFVKLAVFESDTIRYKKVCKAKDFLKEAKKSLKKNQEINDIIISSVGKLNTEDVQYLKEEHTVLELSSKTKVPFQNLYATPKTLGIDRIALVCASVDQFNNTNALIIDAGTCITYDFVTTNNDYLGGAISPGIKMRYNALHNQTANLPLLETNQPVSLIGDSTNNSIHSGVIYGVLNEIDGVIGSYTEKYTDLTVILTGGDANFLSKQLKSSIFANQNFLLEGLNYILEFNKKR